MIDKKILRDDSALIETNLKKRGVKANVKKLAELDAEIRRNEEKIEKMRSERKAGSKTKPSEQEQQKLQELREEINELENSQKEREIKLFNELAAIPNFLHESVPVGATEDDNELIEEVGEKTEFDFDPKAHNEIESVKHGIDIERGAKVSGARFYYLKGRVAQLERALMNYAIDFIRDKGYELVLPPIMVKEPALFGTGYFPNGRSEVYAVNPGEDDLYLIGTSEQSLMAMHGNEIIEHDSLPLKYAGYSPCFRREAGSYGKDTKGIIRVHQFNKVEMVIIASEENAWNLHEELVAISDEFYKSLKLPYRKMVLCAGDTGAQAAKTVDFEIWFPSQHKYREAGSASSTTDYQSRRLGIRTKPKGSKKTELVHTLNNTVVADRTLLAILENYQQKDGSVVVPDVLQSYCGFDRL